MCYLYKARFRFAACWVSRGEIETSVASCYFRIAENVENEHDDDEIVQINKD